DVANNKRVKVGEKMKIKGRDFVVKGIAEKTLTGPDKMVFMHIEDAQELFIKEDPFLRDLKKANPSAKELQNIYTDANVSWKDGVNADKLAKKIGKEVKDVRTLSPAKASRDFGQASVIFNLIILGSALIAVIVGGFSVINTMIMSISERTREIGIKKAVGAKTRHIIVEYLTEAALIGLIGGFVGLGLGILMVNGFNNQATAGNEIFLVTSRLASSALIFATGLGVFAGLYPAIHAARLNPVEALRAD
ncbi:MAG TPA: FtsX-like permease family protein, partial [Candidatus Subteraquimicrobiales bacterium]